MQAPQASVISKIQRRIVWQLGPIERRLVIVGSALTPSHAESAAVPRSSNPSGARINRIFPHSPHAQKPLERSSPPRSPSEET